MKVGVVIPFYQREKGILTRALDSIRNQDLDENIRLEVIVVDDQSPVSAASEMAAFADTGHISWHSVSQPNGGPGAARNTGIDWLQARGADFIAFLDSDDEWHSDHLGNAISALVSGCDFYFSDHSRTGSFDSYFLSHPHLKEATTFRNAPAHECGPHLRRFHAAAIVKQIIDNYLSQTSTVVLRSAFLGSSRFDPDLRYAGEDHMLWIVLALKDGNICISTQQEVTCGSGLNMFFGAFDWDSEDVLSVLSSQVMFLSKLKRMPSIPNVKSVEETFDRFNRRYAYVLARRLSKRSLPARTGFMRIWKDDPLWPLKAPFLVGRFALFDR